MLNASLRKLHETLGISTSYAETTKLPLQPVPDDLTEIGKDIYNRSQRLRSAAAAAWHVIQNSAAEANVEIAVVSAFRSPEYQAQLIQRQLDRGESIDEILTRVAAPGFSEHHSGCALDLTTPGFEAVEQEFEDSAAFVWLVENAATFGFYMTYPRDNDYGVIYEPWHWCFKHEQASRA